MDVHMKSNSHFKFGTRDAAGHSAQPGDELTSLSREEQETLYFFEQTIDSLEQSLEEDELRPQVQALRDPLQVPNGASNPGPHLQTGPKEQDIIDLVRPKPDLVQTRETFTPTSPDFQNLIQPPDSHFEIKPRSEPVDPSYLSDYNPPIADSHPSYHPPGSVPTPVLIAQKIAETQTGSGSSVLSASSLLRRRSSEFDKSTSSKSSPPPTFTKPARYPSNISVILGSREQPNQSLANINIEERRAQMLANLSGTSHPLVQDEPDGTQRNTPTRSVSFRDPTPEKSRMEALSKLGLTRNRAMSGGVSLPSSPLEPLTTEQSSTNLERSDLPKQPTAHVPEPNILNSPLRDPSSPTHSFSSSKPPEIISGLNVLSISTPPEVSSPPSRSAMATTSSKVPETNPRSPVLSYRKPEDPQPDVQRNLETASYSAQQNDYFPFPPPPPPVETSPEFNSYGGKSVVVNPSGAVKSDSPSSPISPEPKNLPPILATPSEFNPYGGKSKVMAPVAVPVSRRDLPDILSSHLDKSQTESISSDSNSYGGKTRTVNPSGRPSEGLSRTLKPPAPLPAPRPQRHSHHGPVPSPKSPPRALSPEHRRRTSSQFRPQGITVQFSGKGATDESRREALRKLGLLKD